MPPTPAQLIASGPSNNQAPESRASAIPFEPLPTNTPPKEETSQPPPQQPAPQPAPKAPKVQESLVDQSINDESRASDVLKMFEQRRDNVPQPESTKKAKELLPKQPEPTEPKAKDETTAQADNKVGDEAATEELPPTADTGSQETVSSEDTGGEDTPSTPAANVLEIPANVAKFMGNPAKEWAAKQLKVQQTLKAELTELKESKAGEKGSSWYEHPESYVLTPEFNSSQQALQQYNGVLRHYQQQLVKIREGEEWEDLTADKDGNIVKLATKQKAGPQADVYVGEKLARARQLIHEEEIAQQAFIQQHQQKSRAIPGVVAEIEKKYFPQYAEGIKSKNPQITKFVETAQQQLAAINQQHNPLASFTLKLYASFLELKLNGAVTQQSAATQGQTIKGPARRTGPTQDNINSGGHVGPTDPDDLPFNPKAWPSR